jgi:hypothetical protein
MAEMFRWEGNIPRLIARTALDADGQLRDAYDETLDALGLKDGVETIIEIPAGWTRSDDATIDALENAGIARGILDRLDACSTRYTVREHIDGGEDAGTPR